MKLIRLTQKSFVEVKDYCFLTRRINLTSETKLYEKYKT